MVRHNNKRVQVILQECFGAVVKSVYHHARHFFAEKPSGPRNGGIQLAIHPHKRLSGTERVGRRKSVVRKTAEEMPGYEERLAVGLQMGKTATIEGHNR